MYIEKYLILTAFDSVALAVTVLYPQLRESHDDDEVMLNVLRCQLTY